MNIFNLIIENSMITLKLCTILFAVGHITATLEFGYLIFRNEYSSDGYCPWNIISLEKPIICKYSGLNDLSKLVYSGVGQRVIIVVQILFLISLIIIPVKTHLFTLLIISLLLIHFVMHFRNPYGGEGADQMSIIVLFSLFIGASSFSSEKMSFYSIVFIAGQSILSYGSAGFAKLFSKKWRKGVAVYEIFNTGSYGHKLFAKIISDRPQLGFLLSWNVILMECLFPIALIFPQPIFIIVFLSWGMIFHFFNSLIMGLNAFFWIFLSTYPCIIYLFFAIH